MDGYNSILNPTKDLVRRKVVRIVDGESALEPKDRPHGEIVAVGMGRGGRIWVVWPGREGEPTPHHARELLARKEEDLSKRLKWHGKTLASLTKFIGQLAAEGATDNTELNPGNEEHVHIYVELPLATVGDAKHDHTFETECTVACPAHAQHFGPKLAEF